MSGGVVYLNILTGTQQFVLSRLAKALADTAL